MLYDNDLDDYIEYKGLTTDPKEEMSKTDWSWTFEGAKALVDYLISVGKVVYCENNGFKLVKE